MINDDLRGPRLPRLYPNTKPTLVLENASGLTEQVLRHLLETLNEKATELVGAEMLYELASLAADYITEHHNVVGPCRDTSLIEERITRASEADKLQQVAIQSEKARQTALKANQDIELARQIQKDLDARAAMYKQEREKASITSATVRRRSVSIGQCGSSLLPEPEISITTPQLTLLVHRGSDITNARFLGKVFEAHIVDGGSARLQVVEPRGRYYTTTQALKKLQKVTADLDCLRDLSHQNLHRIHGSKLQDGYLTIVTEPLPTSSLSDVLNQCGALRLDKGLEYLHQLINGLCTIHRARMVHRGIPFVFHRTIEPPKSTESFLNPRSPQAT